MRGIPVLLPILLALSACSGESRDSQASNSGPSGDGDGPALAEPYRESFERAWASAGEGRSPTQACSGVFGRAVGMLQTPATAGEARSDALAALDACYVRAMARFVDVRLSAENSAMAGCISLLQTLPVHRVSLGSFLDTVGEDRDAYNHRLNELIADKVGSACPDSAAVILEI